MKKLGLHILIIMLSLEAGLAQEIFQTNRAHISFYSSAPIEDIKAVSMKGSSLLNSSTGEIIFKVRMRSFEFARDLMQEHFNENYIESHKYPEATFRGTITPLPKLDFPGEHDVLIKGNLNIHGQSRPREISATITISENQLHLKTVFNVANADHDIKIPRLMFRNIAEVIEVSVDALYTLRSL